MMRRIMISAMAAVMAVSMAGCGQNTAGSNTASTEDTSAQTSTASDDSSTSDSGSEQLDGGWETPATPELTDEAKKALEKATENLDGATYKPVALLGTQIVAGTNYKILCRTAPVVPDAVETYAIVTVYEDLDGNCEITDVQDSGRDTDIVDDETMTGGWEQAESPVMTDDEKEVFDKAFGSGNTGFDGGYKISPVAILSYQVVAGENYCFLAQNDSDGAYVFAYCYENLDGNVSDDYTVDFVTKDYDSADSDTTAVDEEEDTVDASESRYVKVDGTVYQDTGYLSSALGCGNMDGEIISSVDESEIPEEDNQGNFGTGYGWQRGLEGAVIVNIDGQMEIFRDVKSSDDSIPEEVATFIGKVEEINDDTVLIKYLGLPDSALCSALSDGEYTASAEKIRGDVKVNDTVQVWHTGSVAETYPAQIGAYRIEKTDKEPVSESAE